MIKFSFVIPFYNGSKYIEPLLNAINNQTYKEYQIIIINDFSKDEEKENLLSISNKFLFENIIIKHNHVNQGLIKTLNIGLRLAENNNVIVIGQDDFIQENHLASIKDHIKKYNNNYGAIFCDALYVRNEDITTQFLRDKKLDKFKDNKIDFIHLSRWNYIVSTGICLNKENLLSVGGFNEQYRNHGEWLTWLSICKFGIYLNKNLFSFYRRHDSNITNKLFKKEFKSTFDYYNSVNKFAYSISPKNLKNKYIFVFCYLRNLLLLIYKNIFS